jgi:hypothetical protein
LQANTTMDELESFGRLSTSAKEWKPSSMGGSVSSNSNSSNIYNDNIGSQQISNTISLNQSIPTTPTIASKASSSYTIFASNTPDLNLHSASIISHIPTLPGLPTSPTITSPMRMSGLLPSPPGRIAWQQDCSTSSKTYGEENFINPYVRAENNWLGTSSMISQDVPIWSEGEYDQT